MFLEVVIGQFQIRSLYVLESTKVNSAIALALMAGLNKCLHIIIEPAYVGDRKKKVPKLYICV